MNRRANKLRDVLDGTDTRKIIQVVRVEVLQPSGSSPPRRCGSAGCGLLELPAVLAGYLSQAQ